MPFSSRPPPAPDSWLNRSSISARLAAIVLVFVFTILVLLVVVTFSSALNSGVRAYVGAEGLWSKGQKDAVYYLMRYAQSRDEQDYRKYLAAIAIPLGDRVARLELEKPSYDYSTVERGFVQGQNAAGDVPHMVFLFRRFHDAPRLAEAIRIWTEADTHIARLTRCADELHAAISSGTLTAERAHDLLNRIEEINAQLTPLEHDFSAALGEGSRWTRRVILTTIFAVATLLLSGGLWLSWRIAQGLRDGIQNLREGALRVSKGDLDHPIAVSSRDELGELAIVFNDMIVHRREAEEALKASTALLGSVIGTAYDAFIAMDAQGRVSDWNHQAETTFGWPRAEALNRPLSELIIPVQNRQAHENGLKRFLQTGEGPVLNKRIELTALHRDGHEFPVELTIWPSAAGGTYRFNAFLHDISERHRMVRRLAAQKAAATALLESATLAGAGIAVLQAVCGALEWDVGALWLPNAAGSELRCDTVWHRDGVRIPEFESITRRITLAPGIGLPGRVWTGGEPVWIPDVTLDSNFPRAKYALQDGLHGAFGFPIFNGSDILGVVEFFSSAIQKPDQDLLRMMETLGNLLGQFIGRKRAEAELKARAVELARSNEELERFAYIASHDLQEPLRTVTSYTQLLARRFSRKEETESAEFIGFITDAVQRMRALIDGLLSYSRVSQQVPTFKPVDLNRVLDDALANLKNGIESSGAIVSRDSLPLLDGDGAQLAQVFQNLIGNALKFRGPSPPRVQVSAVREGKDWRISVRDNGIGIDPQYAERIFVLFQRLHPNDRYPGSGLGLAICQKIVERHGGRIWVEPSNPGSAFHFTLRAS